MNKEQHQDDRLVVRLVDALLKNAVRMAASDVHLEPMRDTLRVRYRIDGLLHEQDAIESTLAPQIISRLKVLAHINIAQRRVPQDGKLQLEHDGRTIDVRVSTFPALYGEKVVLRLLDRVQRVNDLPSLGFDAKTLQRFMSVLNHQHGLVLVTGPTGSGKTTTLYAALAELNSPHKHIITLEDPVEYSVDGVTQGHINTDTGFTFERGIRAMLRQDPDILLIGEIRDKQTACIAIEAALTGHLVLSTLHTNDAPSAIIRLMDMGIEPFLLQASLIGVLAQRLVRVACATCAQRVQPTESELLFLTQQGVRDVDVLVSAQGCSACNNTGYKGRTGVFELLTMTDAMRALLVNNPVMHDVRQQAYADGMQPLTHDALHKVQNGTTTIQEAIRVVI